MTSKCKNKKFKHYQNNSKSFSSTKHKTNKNLNVSERLKPAVTGPKSLGLKGSQPVKAKYTIRKKCNKRCSSVIDTSQTNMSKGNELKIVYFVVDL